MRVLKHLALAGLLALASCNQVYAQTPRSFHFEAVPRSTLVCSAGTVSSFVKFADGTAANAPDVIIRNNGTVPIYFEMGQGGMSVVAHIPTSNTAGSQVINPGEADLLSKYFVDTIACVTASGTGVLTVTPGTGN